MYMAVDGEVYRNAICIFRSDALSFCLTLLKRMLVLELGPHGGCGMNIPS